MTDLKSLLSPFRVQGMPAKPVCEAVTPTFMPAAEPGAPSPLSRRIIRDVQAGNEHYSRIAFFTGHPEIDRVFKISGTSYADGDTGSVSIRPPRKKNAGVDELFVYLSSEEEVDLLIEALKQAKAHAFPPGSKKPRSHQQGWPFWS